MGVMVVDQKIAGTCWARHTCKQHGKLCSTACTWYIDLKYQLELSGIPKRHQKFNVDTLPDDTYRLNDWKRWSESNIQRIAAGQGLYLWGATGVGKTTLVCSLAISYIITQTRQDLRDGKRTRQLVQFVNVPDLLVEIKEGFNDEEKSSEAARKIEALKRVPLAIFDDIGAERPSEWVRERLLTLIGERYDKELCTFFTSNLKPAELEEPLGRRIRSRIEGMSIPVEIKGPDRRRLF